MSTNKKIYSVLLIPSILGIFGYLDFGFFFKSGTAGFGILMSLYIYFKENKKPNDIWFVIMAFVFSIAGDWFLSTRNGQTDRFVIGIGLFFVAHIGYLSYALVNGAMKKQFTAIFTAVFLVYYALVLFPAIDEMVLNVAVLIYLLISCLSFGIAVGFRGNREAAAAYIFGIFLVLFSDTIISIKEFVGIAEVDFLILPTYYMAHIAVTYAVMKKSAVFSALPESNG